MVGLADAVLPLIPARGEVWRWSAANEHGARMHEAVDILETATTTGDPGGASDLPVKDRLAIADRDYNASFGGIGSLEGGDEQGTESRPKSSGQPIFEFRSLPSTLQELEKVIGPIAALLAEVNST